MGTNIQVQSSLILLTFDETIKYINSVSKATLQKITDIKTSQVIWGQGGGHVVTDIDFKMFILTFDKFVDIPKFKKDVAGGFLGGKFKNSIVNIQIPWSELQTTAPTNGANNNPTNITNNPNNGTNNNPTNLINEEGAYRIEPANNGSYNTTVKGPGGNIQTFRGNSYEAVEAQVNAFLNPE
jgi:hypothetical protein